MALITLALVRNEMSRFLPHALRAWASFSDEILILDDGSTDESATYARAFGAHVSHRTRAPAAWGAEAAARMDLFRFGWANTRVDDYIMILDADMTPARDPRVFMRTGADAILFNLYDLWRVDDEGRLFYREDGAWQAHRFPRVWMVRRTAQPFEDFAWHERSIHVGHLPLNLNLETLAYAPPDHGLLHYAYVTEELREAKYEAYARIASTLTDFELSHARSILSPPILHELPFTPEIMFG